MIQVSKVKKVFHDNGLQVSAEAMNMIKDDFSRLIHKMAEGLKESNAKRLTVNNYHFVNPLWSVHPDNRDLMVGKHE